MYDELIAFIGLIVLELKNYIREESKIEDDLIFEEVRTELNTIIKRLHVIQESLINPQSYNDSNCSYIKEWENDYKLSTIQTLKVEKEYPVGYCFVARAVCKRLSRSKITDELYYFLETLGYYIKYNYCL